MELKELKALASDYNSFEEWSLTFFKEYSKDEKFISPLDYDKIIASLSDEYGIDNPSKEEVESMKSKKEKEFYASLGDTKCMMKKIPFPKQDDNISFMEYCDKLLIILDIIILKLDN